MRLFHKRDSEFAVQLLLNNLADPADTLSLFACPLFRRLLEMLPQAHLAKHALLLQLFLERSKRLIDIIVSNECLHGTTPISVLLLARSHNLKSGALARSL